MGVGAMPWLDTLSYMLVTFFNMLVVRVCGVAAA
jgi:hypothetical protein